MDPVTEKFIGFSHELAVSLSADAILISTDVFAGRIPLERLLHIDDMRVVLVMRKNRMADLPSESEVIRVPDVSMSRHGQIKVAILLGLSRGTFRRGDKVVWLTGAPGSGVLDTVLYTQVAEELGFLTAVDAERIARHVQPEVFERVFDIAVSLGNEGREGKSLGSIFVVGDIDHVRRHCQQMILNPFKGYSEQERNILDKNVEETVKELASIDGAFLIRSDGVVESAGVFLHSPASCAPLPRGLGARHKSACDITAATDCVSITISQSTGNVSVFLSGHLLVEVSRPHPLLPQSEAADNPEAQVRPDMRQPPE
jgi:diadenylate cyclase